MPFLSRSLTGHGAVVELLVGVNQARREVLTRNGFPVPPRVPVLAQIDTGTTFSTVDGRVLQSLSIQPIDSVLVRTPGTRDTPQSFNRYAVSLGIVADQLEMLLTSVEVL